jgi:uncharacterized protein (DUF2225 family)
MRLLDKYDRIEVGHNTIEQAVNNENGVSWSESPIENIGRDSRPLLMISELLQKKLGNRRSPERKIEKIQSAKNILISIRRFEELRNGWR